MEPARQAWRRVARRLAPWPVHRAAQGVRRWRRGHIYGWPRPAWWPARLPWPGPGNPHAGKSVVIFAGKERCELVPALYGHLAGHVYPGTLRPDAADLAARLVRLGLPANAARTLAIVSGFEGGFDAIQTYDRGKFAWGFIQFTLTGGLPRLLQTIQAAAPDVFATVFRASGIGVEDGQVVLHAGGRTLRGRAMHDRLHDDPAFWAPFVHASRLSVVQDLQVRVAFERYYASSLAVTVPLGARKVTLGELFAASEWGRAVACDRAVHRGIGHVRALFQAAARHCQARSLEDAGAILACVRAMEAVDGGRLDALAAALDRTDVADAPLGQA